MIVMTEFCRESPLTPVADCDFFRTPLLRPDFNLIGISDFCIALSRSSSGCTFKNFVRVLLSPPFRAQLTLYAPVPFRQRSFSLFGIRSCQRRTLSECFGFAPLVSTLRSRFVELAILFVSAVVILPFFLSFFLWRHCHNYTTVR